MLMSLRLLLAALLVVATTNTRAQRVDVPRTPPTIESVQKAQSRQGPVFIENKGQWDSRVQFLLRSGGLDTWITDRGVVYDVYQMTPSKNSDKHNTPDVQAMQDKARAMDRRGHVVSINFTGASVTTTSLGVDPQPGHHNYFIGNDKTKWASNVALYGRAEVQGLYPGVDAVFYLDGGKPRYDLVVKPGANTSQVRMSIEGAKSVKVDAAGSLSIQTTMGAIEQRGLYAYQEVDGKRQQVKCDFVVDGKRTVTFNVGKYDRSRPLVIDPLVYSTYLGGSSFEDGQGIAIDGSGNVYITGYTTSTNFPTLGAYQSSYSGGGGGFYGGGSEDAFVTKLNSGGSTLAYSTYLGGSGNDLAFEIAVDGSGNAYVVGGTRSTNFPVSGAYQSANAGGADAFVTKLNSSGSALAYSTYLGGSGSIDDVHGIAVDGSGNAYVVGSTNSTNFPTAGAYQSTYGGGTRDAIVTKLNSSGNTLVYSTYLGGSDFEYAIGVAIDGSGNAYVTGRTYSTNFPTAGAYQSTNAGSEDAFVTKLNSSGSTLTYSTYIGGSNADAGHWIAIDGSGNAYVTGWTYSTNYPTAGAYQSSSGGGQDVFVTKLNSGGSTLAYSTYLGGSGSEFGVGIAVDGSGNAYVAGLTSSTNFPTSTAYQSSNGGGFDAFVTRLNSGGSTLAYSTYLGGTSNDYGTAIAVDGSSNAYITGFTSSTNFPTSGAYQAANGGSQDVFVAKLSYLSVTLTAPNGGQTWCPGTSQNVTWTSSGITNVKIELSTNSGSSYTSTIVASTSASGGSYSWSIPSNLASGTAYRIRISDASVAATNDASDANFTINTLPTPSISGSTTPCQGTDVVYSVPNVAGSTYAWTTPTRGSIIGSSTQRTVTIRWNSTGSDVVSMRETITATGCYKDATLSVSVQSSPSPTITGTASVNVCEPRQVVYSVTSVTGHTYAWTDPTRGDIVGSSTARTVTIEWKSTGSDTVVMTQTQTSTGCSKQAKLAVSIAKTALPLDNTCIRVTDADVTCQGSDAQGRKKYKVTFTFDNVRTGTNFIRIYESGQEGSTYTYPFHSTSQSVTGMKYASELALPVTFSIDVYDVLASGKVTKCSIGYCVSIGCGSSSRESAITGEQADESVIGNDAQTGATAMIALAPNPAADVVEILMDIPSYDPQSTLDIIDLHGNVIVTIATSLARGQMVIPAQLQSIPSGTYMVRLQSAGTIVVRQMNIVR